MEIELAKHRRSFRGNLNFRVQAYLRATTYIYIGIYRAREKELTRVYSQRRVQIFTDSVQLSGLVVLIYMYIGVQENSCVRRGKYFV